MFTAGQYLNSSRSEIWCEQSVFIVLHIINTVWQIKGQESGPVSVQ